MKIIEPPITGICKGFRSWLIEVPGAHLTSGHETQVYGYGTDKRTTCKLKLEYEITKIPHIIFWGWAMALNPHYSLIALKFSKSYNQKIQPETLSITPPESHDCRD